MHWAGENKSRKNFQDEKRKIDGKNNTQRKGIKKKRERKKDIG